MLCFRFDWLLLVAPISHPLYAPRNGVSASHLFSTLASDGKGHTLLALSSSFASVLHSLWPSVSVPHLLPVNLRPQCENENTDIPKIVNFFLHVSSGRLPDRLPTFREH